MSRADDPHLRRGHWTWLTCVDGNDSLSNTEVYFFFIDPTSLAQVTWQCWRPLCGSISEDSGFAVCHSGERKWK